MSTVTISNRTKVQKMVQGSPEWHKFRSHHCNASESAAAMNRSPFIPRNMQQLTEVRAGLRKVFITSAMNYGHEHEPAVRDYLEATYLEIIQPEVWECNAHYIDSLGVEHNIPLACSVDGRDMNGVIYEIKCPASPTSETVTKAKDGLIPDYYRDQVQQQLLVTGCRECCFAVRDPADGQVYTIWLKADEEHQRRIVEAWIAVWPFLRDGKTIVTPEGDLEFDSLCEAYVALKQKFSEVDAALEAIKDKLIARVPSDESSMTSKTYGLTVTKQTRAGTINYKKIPELKGVDLDLYRSEATEFWTIKVK